MFERLIDLRGPISIASCRLIKGVSRHFYNDRFVDCSAKYKVDEYRIRQVALLLGSKSTNIDLCSIHILFHAGPVPAAESSRSHSLPCEDDMRVGSHFCIIG